MAEEEYKEDHYTAYRIGRRATRLLTRSLTIYYWSGWAIAVAALVVVMMLHLGGRDVFAGDHPFAFLVAFLVFVAGFSWFRHRLREAHIDPDGREPWFIALTVLSGIAMVGLVHHALAFAYPVVAAATLARTRAARAVMLLLLAILAQIGLVLAFWPPVEEQVLLLVSVSTVEYLALLYASNLFREWRAVDRLSRLHRDLASTRALLRSVGARAEKSRIAREIHDISGHKLISAKLQLDLLEGETADEVRKAQGGAERIGIIRSLVQELMRELRLVVVEGKATPAIDLRQSLETLVGALPEGLCSLSVTNDAKLTPLQAETVLRVAQEALTNALRHSRAGRIGIDFSRRADGYMLAVSDDGRGGHEAAMRGSRRGIKGMADRLEAVGGRLEISSGPGKGTVVRATIPAEATLPAEGQP